jgi:hypothetical protein
MIYCFPAIEGERISVWMHWYLTHLPDPFPPFLLYSGLYTQPLENARCQGIPKPLEIKGGVLP